MARRIASREVGRKGDLTAVMLFEKAGLAGCGVLVEAPFRLIGPESDSIGY